MKGYVDTHAHYDDKAFDVDRDAVLRSLFDNGIRTIIDPAVDRKSTEKIIDIAQKYDSFFCAAGIHPHEASNASDCDYEYISAVSRGSEALKNKIVAIGETGLDYHYDFSPADVQKVNFRKNIRIALENGLPLIVHDREAHEDTFRILSEEDAFSGKVLYHCYSGSAEYAAELVKKGCFFSFGGAVTFKNAKKFESVLKAIPTERILPETDSPYMAPEPLRGTRNYSGNLRYIYPKLASLLSLDEDAFSELMFANTADFFGIAVK